MIKKQNMTSPTPNNAKSQNRETGEKSNQLHLKLPPVTCDQSAVVNNVDPNGKSPEPDKLSSADGDDEEELFCHEHLMRNRKRMSSELRDLYEVLQKLPTLPTPPSIYDISSRKKSVNVSKERTLRWIVSTTKSNHATIGKQVSPPAKPCRKFPASPQSDSSSSPPTLLNSLSTTPDCCVVCAENDNANGERSRREVIKMRQINLYDLILPSSLFPNNRYAKNK